MTYRQDNLPAFLQGTDQAWDVPNIVRAATDLVPALDLTTATEIEACFVNDSGVELFSKTVTGGGVTVVDANNITIQIDDTDTSALTISRKGLALSIRLTITEADGRITKPWRGSVHVHADACGG